MRRYTLLAGVAAAAVAFAPAAASAQDGVLADIVDELGDTLEDRPDEGVELGLEGTVEVHYENEIETEIETDIDFTKDVTLAGTVNLNGDINVDAAAVAVVDNKQALVGNTLWFNEENELNGENGFVDEVFGQGYSEPGDLPGGFFDGELQPQIRAGFFAPLINTVSGFSVDVEGNVGMNLSAGNFNIQENIAALAVSNFEGDGEEAAGGMAEASLTALQLTTLNRINDDPNTLEEDDKNNFRTRNTVFDGEATINANGNLGLNAAAGNMNLQKNALVLAVATDAAMAEATAGVIQASVGNFANIQDETNIINPGTYTGSGNLGVNLTAGNFNQQMNSLVAAVGDAGAGNGGGGMGPGDGS